MTLPLLCLALREQDFLFLISGNFSKFVNDHNIQVGCPIFYSTEVRVRQVDEIWIMLRMVARAYIGSPSSILMIEPPEVFWSHLRHGTHHRDDSNPVLCIKYILVSHILL